MKQFDHKPITLKAFRQAIREVLLKLADKKSRCENRESTTDELNQGWKLERWDD